MNENLIKRIGDEYLQANHKDGETFLHTDYNEFLSIFKTSINENYYDIQKIIKGTLKVYNTTKLDGATLSRLVNGSLSSDDNTIPSSKQVKSYVDNYYNELSKKDEALSTTVSGAVSASNIAIDTANSAASDASNALDIATQASTQASRADFNADTAMNTATELSRTKADITEMEKRALTTETGNKILFSVDPSTYVLTIKLLDKLNNVLSTGTVDLPIESLVMNVSYDDETKSITLTLQNGEKVSFSVSALVEGLVSEDTFNQRIEQLKKDLRTELTQTITDDANSSFNQNVKNKTDSFNENSSLKTTAFNNNAAQKTLDYNNNCISKTNSFNQNSTQKVTEFNDNYTSKLNLFNSNADLRMDEYNANAKNKTEEFNHNAGTFIKNISVNGIPQTIVNNSVDIRIESNTIYGIERNIANNSATSWDRTDNAVGLIANATHDGTEVQNDFDNLYPWSHMKTVNYDPTEKMITATIGDSNFKFDGSNGQVMTIVPEFYFTYWADDTKEHWQISEYAIEGFTKVPGFMLGRYHSAKTTDNKLMSASGMFPEVLKTITSFRNDSKAVGDDFGQMDWRYFAVQLLYLLEYADYNSQAKLGNGYTNLRVSDNDKALVAETNVNRIIIATANANNFKVGQAISVGTKTTWNWDVAKNRLITSITDYSEGDITGKAINFDGDPVNIAVDNVVWSTGQKSGECDVLGMKSGCVANDGKSAVIYRGLENIFGNVWQFVDGINIKDYVAYVCYNPANYVVDKFDGDYNEIGYTNASTNGYEKTLGHDENHPLIMFPTEVGGSANTYLSDYYSQNSGNRIALVGGRWNGVAGSGLWCWYCYSASSIASLNFGSRLLKSTI